MTTAELRQAAERLRSSSPSDPVLTGVILRDLEAVAQAYLAEHPADEEKAVDEAWLRAVGFGPLASDCPTLILRVGEFDLEVIHGMLFLNNRRVRLPLTRGVVRRLASALGGPLKEAP